MKETWTLWNCIPEETQTLLRLYQYQQHHHHLGTPADIPVEPVIETRIEDTEEIERLMRTPPTNSRGVY